MNAAILSAALEYLIAIILLVNYAKEKYKPVLLFGLAMLFYAIAHTVAGTALAWVKQAHNMVYTEFVKDPNYMVWESVRNVIVGLFMFLAIAGMAEYAPKEKRTLIYAYNVLGFIAFLALRFSCVWLFHDVHHPFFGLAQWVYLIPGSLIIAYFSYDFYVRYKDTSTLFIAASFLIYAAILPLYAALKATALINWWYVARALSEVLLLIGVLKA